MGLHWPLPLSAVGDPYQVLPRARRSSLGEAGARGRLDVAERAELRDATVTGVVTAFDGYLIAGILLLVAPGLYELFINRIEPAMRSEVAPWLLRVRSLDDLKGRLAMLLLLILASEFFQRALRLTYDDALDLLYRALGILLIGAAFALSSVKFASGPRDDGTAS